MNEPMNKMLDDLKWRPLPLTEHGDLPYATHEGILQIGSQQLRVYRLNTGQRVIEESDLIRFFEGD